MNFKQRLAAKLQACPVNRFTLLLAGGLTRAMRSLRALARRQPTGPRPGEGTRR